MNEKYFSTARGRKNGTVREHPFQLGGFEIG